ncbi:hypothetical protein Tco_0882403 [Tanacetum coccineum]
MDGGVTPSGLILTPSPATNQGDTLTPNQTVDFHHYSSPNPPYIYNGWKIVPVVEGSSETTTDEIILTGIDNDIYSTVDACPNACEMWKAIERLKQGESINVQDLETNLYWEFWKIHISRGPEWQKFVTPCLQETEEKQLSSSALSYDPEPATVTWKMRNVKGKED